ncbi:MAG TPA: type II toxin-antitoxin system VapC family toxin [Acidimicrobiales bacterium]|nr:type II toxin-antitoxin system VapC family toxin [Acidimicrobiales bacterium]
MLVVDASVIAPAVADAGADGAAFRQRLRGEMIAVPDLLGVEVVSVLRRQVAASLITPAQASAALDDLLDLPLSVFPTGPLLRRVWQLRENLTAYDACYVALAEALDCTLLTADARLTNAPGARCSFESA